jgi:hypothetical protein
MERDVEKDTSARVSVRFVFFTAFRWMVWIHLDGAAGRAVVPDIARNGCVFCRTIKKVYLLLRMFS